MKPITKNGSEPQLAVLEESVLIVESVEIYLDFARWWPEELRDTKAIQLKDFSWFSSAYG